MAGGPPHRFGILGPLEAVIDGQPCEPTAPRQRALLALMLLSVGEPLSSDRILERLWGDDIPDGGNKTVGFHLSKLRDALEPDRERGSEGSLIQTTPAGYVLSIEPEAVDLHRFERLADEAGALIGTDPGRASLLARDALGLIRGPILAEFAYDEFAQETIRRIDERRLRVLETRIEADLALGRHGDVVPELEGLVEDHPLREGLRAALMLALYRAGRQAEALRAFEQGRRVLADELGIDPSRALRDLEQQILEQDPDLDLPIWADRPAPDPGQPRMAPEAETVYARMPAEAQVIARDIFLRLVGDPAKTPTGIRVAPITEVHGLGHQPSVLDEVLAEFGAAGLLRFDRDPVTDLPTVAIADPALLRAWGRLEAWGAAVSGELATRDRLAELAGQWDRHERSTDYLIGGDRLKEFQQFAATTSLSLTATERDFLESGRRAIRRSMLIARGRDLAIGAAVVPHLLPDGGEGPADLAAQAAADDPFPDPLSDPLGGIGIEEDEFTGFPSIEDDQPDDLDDPLDGF